MAKIKSLFENVLSVGIDNTYSYEKIKKIRTLNGIAFIAGIVLILTGFVIYFLISTEKKPELALLDDFFFGSAEKKNIAKEHWLIFYPVFDFVLGLITLSTLLLNRIKKFKISIYLLCITSTILVSFFYLTSGAIIIYFFFAPTILPIVFLNRKSELNFLIGFNVIILVVLSYILFRNDALFIMPEEKSLITLLINYFVVLIMLLLVIIHFKNENKRNEGKLQKQNKVLQKQSEEISTQRDELFDMNKQIQKQSKKIIASIEYAKKIQHAVLPQNNMFSKIFDETFVFYAPRDIVSGDFYWVKKCNNKTVFAVADCTGHGVPGAFMSMLGVSLLNEIVHEKSVDKSAGAILNTMRQRVKTTLKQTGRNREQKDGMDISLCIFDKQTHQIQYSGANNPVYIIRNKNEVAENDVSKNEKIRIQNSSSDNMLIEIKPTKNPIGVYRKEKTFENHVLQVFKNDKIYLFSDGYADQFNGKTNQKFSKKRFKELLLSVSEKPMITQKQMLTNEFYNWKGNYFQLDDVLVMGIKI